MVHATLRRLSMKKFLIVLLLLIGSTLPAPAQQVTLYNPTLVQFTSPDHAIVTFYRAEFWIVGQPLVGNPTGSYDVPVAKITVAELGPPPVYQFLLSDVRMFLPFGKSYMLRLLACKDSSCSPPSEVAREFVRYTYCKGTDTSVQPMTIAESALPIGVPGSYIPVLLTINSVQPVHAVSIALVGASIPAFYFTGSDMRNTIMLSVGPLPRAGRYLMNISAADEFGCSTSQATQYLTIR